MKKTRIIILGAGVSGLSLGYFLSKTNAEITILEKSSRAGGWLDTCNSSGYAFELGPRSFKVSRSPALLQLCAELGLEDDIVLCSSKRLDRYIWMRGKLHRMPTNPFSMLFSPLTRKAMLAMLKEWSVSPSLLHDETIADFVQRRFNEETARYLFNPLTVGIYAGDIGQLSVRSCFPKLKEWEDRYGSITKGFFLSKFHKSPKSALNPSSFFTFRGGVETLVKALNHCPIHLNQEVKKLTFTADGARVVTHDHTYEADLVYSALPAHALASLLPNELASPLSEVKSGDLTVVSLGYKGDILPIKGYGYLVPTYENEDVLGVVFDSALFPGQSDETRLTAMIKGTTKSDEHSAQVAVRDLKRHLNLHAIPDQIHVKRAERAIPHFTVGHQRRMEEWEKNVAATFPRLRLVGNYLGGVSVNDCIAKAFAIASDF